MLQGHQACSEKLSSQLTLIYLWFCTVGLDRLCYQAIRACSQWYCISHWEVLTSPHHWYMNISGSNIHHSIIKSAPVLTKNKTR